MQFAGPEIASPVYRAARQRDAHRARPVGEHARRGPSEYRRFMRDASRARRSRHSAVPFNYPRIDAIKSARASTHPRAREHRPSTLLQRLLAAATTALPANNSIGDTRDDLHGHTRVYSVRGRDRSRTIFHYMLHEISGYRSFCAPIFSHTDLFIYRFCDVPIFFIQRCILHICSCTDFFIYRYILYIFSCTDFFRITILSHTDLFTYRFCDVPIFLYTDIFYIFFHTPIFSHSDLFVDRFSSMCVDIWTKLSGIVYLLIFFVSLFVLISTG